MENNMHELSVAMSIVDLATEAVHKANAQQVDVIELDIGTMAGVEMDALDFAWPLAVKDTVLAHSEKLVNKIQAVGKCSNCHCQFNIIEPYQECPYCGEVLIQYVKGKELRVKSIVVS
jgi:hydrogenase nickel incorporation protein HypA/HybF